MNRKYCLAKRYMDFRACVSKLGMEVSFLQTPRPALPLDVCPVKEVHCYPLEIIVMRELFCDHSLFSRSMVYYV